MGVQSTSAAAPATAQGSGFLDRLVDIRELVAGLKRSDQEEVLVGVAGAEPSGAMSPLTVRTTRSGTA